MAGRLGRSGRNRKPAALRKLEGNRSHRPIPAEPKATGTPQVPDYFTDEQRKLWILALEHLPSGVVTGADAAAVEVFVISWWTLRQARRDINRTGLLVQGSQGQPIRNPLLGIARGAAADMHAFGADLGMSPVARTRLVAIDDGEIDPMQLLLGMDGEMADLPTQ